MFRWREPRQCRVPQPHVLNWSGSFSGSHPYIDERAKGISMWLWVKNQWYHFGVGEFTTNFSLFQWLDWNVHWGLTDLDFEKPMAMLNSPRMALEECSHKSYLDAKWRLGGCQLSRQLATSKRVGGGSLISGWRTLLELFQFAQVTHAAQSQRICMFVCFPVSRERQLGTSGQRGPCPFD